ncbi:MAG: amidophosphoribosyltransferase [Candidatus Hydrothermarchaeota archaeon]
MFLGEKCAVFGINSSAEVSNSIYEALHVLQHRGQESAGIATFDGSLYLYKGMGLVSEVFNRELLSTLKGTVGIGHVRYSTAGVSALENAQPLYLESKSLSIVIGHNGHVMNFEEIKSYLKSNGVKLSTTSDSEAIGALLLLKGNDFESAFEDIMRIIKGSYCLTILTSEGDLISVRDPLGFRPLSLGRNKTSFMTASETVAFDILNANHERDVSPGELVYISDGFECYKICDSRIHRHCMFEFVYFARPDSIVENRLVYQVREKIGRTLAREHPVDADLVVPVPESAVPASIAYSNESGIPLALGLTKNRYVGRTFLMPYQEHRENAVHLKLNPMEKVLKGKSIVLLDDSIVRGTTSKRIVELVRSAGAKEIHMRIGCPPIKGPCFFGIDIATKEELIASFKTVEEIRKLLNADSLGYLSIEGLINSIGLPENELCIACLTGEYHYSIE